MGCTLFGLLQMEDFLVGKGSFNMPPAEGLDTIFEFLVNEQGEWEHWSERVSCLRRIKKLCFSLQSGDKIVCYNSRFKCCRATLERSVALRH